MSDVKAAAGGMLAAIERSGYYPGLVADAVSAAVGSEPVVSYVVTHDAHFDPGMEVRRHMTVLALTPTRLVFSHTDEYPADETDPESKAQAETSSEAVRFSRIASVALTRAIHDPASYVSGVTMPSEVVLTIGWNALSHIELEPAHCGDENCEADHGYTGTMTADDLTLRVSEAADGRRPVRRQALSAAAAHDGGGDRSRAGTERGRLASPAALPLIPRYGESSLADLATSILASLGVPGQPNPLGLPRPAGSACWSSTAWAGNCCASTRPRRRSCPSWPGPARR